MLSRLQATSQLTRAFYTRLQNESKSKVLQNVISKRWSGHNNMEIKPSNADWLITKNWMHFYFLLGMIPASIIVTIISVRANPELSEVPDGYEPRPWEYYKHPISRWMVKYMYTPMELDDEVLMGHYEFLSESGILSHVTNRVNKVMKFYQDHRSMFFTPGFGEYFRIGREEALWIGPFGRTETGYRIDQAYDPDINPVPTEGYLDGPISKD